MTTKQLGFQAPPTLAIAAGATSPNPGISGVQVWSSTEGAPLVWNGAAWAAIGGSTPSTVNPSLANLPDADYPTGQMWVPSPYVATGTSPTSNVGGIGNGTFTPPASGSGTYQTTHASTSFSQGGATYAGAGVAGSGFCIKRGGSGFGGFLMCASIDFSTYANGTFGWAGVVADEGLYGTWVTTMPGIAIGFETTHTGNSLYLSVGNGTTRTDTLLTRTGAGYSASSGRKFRVMIACPPGSTTATVDAIDLSNGYPMLDKVSVDVSGIPAGEGLNLVALSNSWATSTTMTTVIYEAYAVEYPQAPTLANVTVNTDTTGNAATADALNTLGGLPQGGATSSQVLTWNGSAWAPATAGGGGASVATSDTAPSSPSVGDLWVNTTDLSLNLRFNDGNTEQWVEVGAPAGGGISVYASLSAIPIASSVAPPAIAYAEAEKRYFAHMGSYWAEITSLSSATIVGGAGDTLWANVSLLLHMDGVNGSTQIYDSSDNPTQATTVGTARLSTTQSKFGGASLALLGTGDHVAMGVAGADDFNFGTGDFCIEGFCRLASPTVYQFLLGEATGASNQMMLAFNQPAGSIGVGLTNVSWPLNFTGFSVAANTWFHIAVTRQGTSARCFIDGVQIGSTATNSTSFSITSPAIGVTNGGTAMNGYLDEFRVTKGAARYTANFTPPTIPHPNYG